MSRRFGFFFDRLFRRNHLDRQMAEEFQFHVEARAADLVRSGVPADEAQRRARLEFGARNSYEEQCRESRWAALLHDVTGDLRFAARTFRKAPGFTAVAVLTLAIGIASNTAVFSVVNAVLLTQLPYPHPERLVNVWRRHGKGWTGSVSIQDLRDWQQQNSVFEGIAPYATRRFSLRGASEPQAIEAARVGANFFPVMGVAPALGRGFSSDEEIPGHDKVVVLGYDLWTTEFGSDPHVVGRVIDLNDDSYTVIGVAAPGFHYPRPLTNAWVPLAPVGPELRRDAHDFLTVGRLKPGATVEQATAQLNTISDNMGKDHPEDKDLGSYLVPLKEAAVGGVENGLLTAFVVVGLIFLIACANVSTFLLSRAATRQREIAVRLALGARPARIVRQFLVEGCVLAFCAAVFAIFASRWLSTAILAVGRAYFSLAGPVHQDYRAVLFAVVLAAIAAVSISVVVGWNTTRIAVADALKEHATTVAGGRNRIRTQRFLVAAQVACAFFLLIGTGTLVRTFIKLSRIEPGFAPQNLLAMRLPISSRRYNEQHPLSLLVEPMLARIQSLPGVEAAGLVTYLPMQSWGTTTDVRFTKAEPPPGAVQTWAETRAVSGGYYNAMRIAIIRGRAISDTDGKDSEHVAIVNETFVRNYSPKEDVVGRQVFLSDDGWYTIVGVAADTHQQGRDRASLPEIDIPYGQAKWPYLTATMTLAVRTKTDPLDLAHSVRQAVYSVDPGQAIYGVTTMEQIIADVEGDRRFALWLLSVFSALALVLAASGLFAQLSYAVTERMHEIGVRIALGARANDVVGMIVRQGGRVVGAGLVLGLGLSLIAVRVMTSIVFALDPTQMDVIFAAAAPIALVAFAASYIPARRASRIDPLVALREE